MKIVNLTPHPLVFVDENRKVVRTIESSGIARVYEARKQVYSIEGIPVNKVIYGEVTGLPEPEEGTIYIVSSIVAQAVQGRMDIYIVDDTIRDDVGRIIGCRALARIW